VLLLAPPGARSSKGLQETVAVMKMAADSMALLEVDTCTQQKIMRQLTRDRKILTPNPDHDPNPNPNTTYYVLRAAYYLLPNDTY
jgi:hypothetical protein